ncbi:hypothetical protein K2W90_06125 [Candidatus Babeliales bacterium]|nr:hypothetical protein [Candidatus Babeliales bacterium]
MVFFLALVLSLFFSSNFCAKLPKRMHHALPVHMQALLDDTLVTNVDAKVRNGLKADISFLGIDMKYRDGVLKVCEFVEGKNASALTSEAMVNGVATKLTAPYWIFFWHYLSQFDLPVWYIGKNPAKNVICDHSVTLSEKLYWDDFLRMGGRYASSIPNLKKDVVFLECLLTQEQLRDIKVDQFSGYQGLVIYGYRDDRFSENNLAIAAFKKQYPQFLVLDAATTPFATSKKRARELFEGKVLEQFRPRWGLHKKKYTKELVSDILKSLKSEYVVIKPLNSGRSNGVIITHREELDATLKNIFSSKRYAFNHRPKESSTYEYWKGDTNKFFIAEEFCQSKTIEVYDQPYDPTMRMFCIMRYDNGKIYTTILPGFWKVPPKSLTEEGTFTEKHKTVPTRNNKLRGIQIDPTDVKGARTLLKKMLPQAYLKMLQQRV